MSTQTWNLKSHNVEVCFTTPKMASFRDLEQKWCAKVGALMELQWWGRRREWQHEREREKSFWNFGLSEQREHLLFEWSKEGPLFSWCDSYSSTRREKIWPFEMLKSCLNLHAVFLVPVPRVSLHPSGPVFESKQYIYQNAQNGISSVVQRLVLLNFKLHAKR